MDSIRKNKSSQKSTPNLKDLNVLKFPVIKSIIPTQVNQANQDFKLRSVESMH